MSCFGCTVLKQLCKLCVCLQCSLFLETHCQKREAIAGNLLCQLCSTWMNLWKSFVPAWHPRACCWYHNGVNYRKRKVAFLVNTGSGAFLVFISFELCHVVCSFMGGCVWYESWYLSLGITRLCLYSHFCCQPASWIQASCPHCCSSAQSVMPTQLCQPALQSAHCPLEE